MSLNMPAPTSAQIVILLNVKVQRSNTIVYTVMTGRSFGNQHCFLSHLQRGKGDSLWRDQMHEL